jgi:hypothetical protein
MQHMLDLHHGSMIVGGDVGHRRGTQLCPLLLAYDAFPLRPLLEYEIYHRNAAIDVPNGD